MYIFLTLSGSIAFDTTASYSRFRGLPAPRTVDRYNGKQGQWSTSKQDFLDNLKAFDLFPTDNIIVTEGFFNETLPHSPVEKIAFLRLDGDLYESTRDALEYLYDKVVVGGFIYVDDYHSFAGCKLAVNDFLDNRGLRPQISRVREWSFGADDEAIWWRKLK